MSDQKHCSIFFYGVTIKRINMQIGNLVKKRKKNEALFYMAFALLTGYGCNSSSSAPDAGGYAPQIQSLPVITVMDTTAATYKEFSASLEGSKDIEIRPQVDGYLDKIYVDEGAYVSKGQPLFHINDRPYVEQLNNAKASLAVAKANLVTAEIKVNKLIPLVQNNIVSDVQLKEAKASYDAMSASVAQAQALVQSAGINLGYALVKAPVTGYIGRLHHKTGSLVGLTTSDPLTVISDIRDVYAYFSLSENDFLQFKSEFEGKTVEEKIKKMPPVELVLPDGSTYQQKGKVQLATGQFDNSIGAISFRAVFPNTDRLLRSGNTGKVRMQKLRNKALLVPQQSTFEIQDKTFVFAVGDSNKVFSKPIVISGKTAGYYFVESGVNAGDKIVFEGTGNLRDGMAIKPQPVSMDSLLKVKPI